MSVIENTAAARQSEKHKFVKQSHLDLVSNHHRLLNSLSTVQFPVLIDAEQKALSDKKSIAILCVGDMEMNNAR